MPTTSENNKRIAKNTLFLYVRMLIIMAVTLYTSRVVLDVLGVEDFGIYNIIGGIVVLFAFVNNAMITSTQRFLNYEIGRNNPNEVQRIFSASLTIHIGIVFLTLLLAETIGLWFLNVYINVPANREFTVHWVYQFSVLAACCNIIRTPYNAAIIAHEKMSFYAYISIIEALLRLLIVYLLILSNWDRLIFYAFLMWVVILFVSSCYIIYCLRHFTSCAYQRFWDKNLYKRLVAFSGWSLLGGVANTGASHGLNILLNLFYGVTVNAAMGIANQVNMAVYSFVANFQTAFQPQIIKSYASGDKSYFINLVIKTSKYSYYLLFLISFPFYICCEECLGIWLTEIPSHAVSFCKLMLLLSLLDAIQGPLWISVQATGKIRNYQILISLLILSNLPLSYLALKMGGQAEWVLAIKALVNLLIFIFRLVYLKYLCTFPLQKYLGEVLVRALIVSVLSYGVIYFLPISSNTWFRILLVSICSLFSSCLFIYTIGLNSRERYLVIKQIKKYI